MIVTLFITSLTASAVESDCDLSSEDSLPLLIDYRASLQKELVRNAAAVALARKDVSRREGDPPQTIEASLAALATTSAQIECVEKKIARQEAVGHRTLKQVDSTIHYATNRNLSRPHEIAKLSFGRAVIGAPSNSGRVLLSAQSLVDLYLKGGGSSPALKSTTTLTSDDMRIDIIGAKSILIYVHGYNSSFEDAAV